jgi:secondary thiamine-phosphate synthase enzyme
MIKEISLSSSQHNQTLDITAKVRVAVKESGVQAGICLVYCPHTTAGITINENADPDVQYDMIKEIQKIVPLEDGYRHYEGNSAAHLKATLFGFSQHLIIHNGNLLLGTWQGIYFCEFDGPRQRKVYIKIIAG